MDSQVMDTSASGSLGSSGTIRKKDVNLKKISSKMHRQSGAAYLTRKGKSVPAREFNSVECKCPNECKTITTETKKFLFQQYWELCSWDSQNAFLIRNVKEVSIASLS